MLARLHRKVLSQIGYCRETHPTLGQVEMIIDCSKRFLEGGKSIGEKREGLKLLAKGDYVCFLDDDEDVSPDYVETLLRLCNENEDVCTFRNISKLANNWALIDMSIYNSNEQLNPDRITKREPWHICPVRNDYAQLYSFTDLNYGEDWMWFKNVLNHCKTEAKTDKIIHQYNHGAHSEADKIK